MRRHPIEELSEGGEHVNKPVRQQRRAALREKRRGGNTGWVWIAAFVGLLVLGGLVLVAGRGTQTATALKGTQTFEVRSRFHTQGRVNYPQTPPVGGDHAPIWQNCGFYNTPIQPEAAVHSLEHGAVWITYRPDLPAAQVTRLRDLARGQTFLLVSPFPGLPAPVVASAWGIQLRVQSTDDPRLPEFVRAYRLGPQTPELGAPCTRGVGEPG